MGSVGATHLVIFIGVFCGSPSSALLTDTLLTTMLFMCSDMEQSRI